MIITIDGYAGSGKSSAARGLADALPGFTLLNTGAMYRAAGLALQDAGLDIYADPPDLARVAELVADYSFDMSGDRTVLNGVDFTPRLQTPGAGAAASRVGLFAPVRERLKAEQRRIAAGRDMICEGRDQGTAVFPDAAVKFFFTASVEVRARRRFFERATADGSADMGVIARRIEARDRQDETRPLDPLKQAADAVRIDTSEMSLESVLELMKKVVAECRTRG
jgi:cytidylate kinase